MKLTKLASGARVLLIQRPGKTVTVEVLFNVGSLYEREGLRGASHFMEHAVFLGAKKRQTPREIAKCIEAKGGELNAYSSQERTAFYVSIMEKHLPLAIDVLADMICNPLLKSEDIEKEKEVICREIDLYRDQPVHHQWELFMRALYRKTPLEHPVIGYTKDIRSFSRERLLEYYKETYTAENVVFVVCGNIVDEKRICMLLERSFSLLPRGAIKRKVILPRLTKKSVIKEQRKIEQGYLAFGYPASPRNNPDTIVLDVIEVVLGKGQSSWLFEEVRNKRGLAYQIGCHQENQYSFGYFSIYVNSPKKNIPKILKVFYDLTAKLQDIEEGELKDAKEFIEGSMSVDHEETKRCADDAGQLAHAGSSIDEYIKKVRKVSKEDIARVAGKIFSENYAMGLIEPIE